MNEIQVFNYGASEIRTVQRNGQTWWVLKDVCEALGITNPSIVAARLDEDERAKFDLGRQGETNIITESGLYNVILRSDKAEAKHFKPTSRRRARANGPAVRSPDRSPSPPPPRSRMSV